MVQILQRGPTEATLRQQALNDALNTTISGYAAYDKQKKDEALTLRQQALQDNAIQAQQDSADMALAFKANEQGIASPTADLKAFVKGTYQPKEISPAIAATPDQIVETQAAPASPADLKMRDENGTGRTFQLGTAATPAVMGPANPFTNYTEAKRAKIAADLHKQQQEQTLLDSKVQAIPVEQKQKYLANQKLQQDIKYKPKEFEKKQGDVADKEQEKIIQRINQNEMSMKGDIQAQLAGKVIVQSEAAQRLLNKPEWSNEDRKLFAAELGKIASGGVPSESEVHAILPDTASTRYNRALEFITGNPQGMDEAEYKKQMGHYLKDLREINAQYLEARNEKGLRLAGYEKLSEKNKDIYRNTPELRGATSRIEGNRNPSQAVAPKVTQEHLNAVQSMTREQKLALINGTN